MKESMYDDIKKAISLAPGSYSRLILLVGPSESGKTYFLQKISFEKKLSILNVNLEMAKALMELPIKRRESRASYIFNDIIQNFLSETTEGEKLVLLDNLEILFDKDLKLDPLSLLLGISRNIIIIASWNGTYSNNHLSFARTGHPEYRFYEKIDAQVIEISREN